VSEYNSVKKSSDWVVSANCGGQQVTAFNLRTGKRACFELTGQTALSIDINSAGSEVYVLSEEIEKCSDSQEELKQVVVLKLKDDVLSEIDQIKVFPMAKVITTLSKTDFILLEGSL
jgi:hypothetical protein